MEKEAMDKLLTLEEDELVLWSGKPVPFKIMDQYYKPVFIRNYIIAIAIVVLIFAAALIHSAGSGGINFKAFLNTAITGKNAGIFSRIKILSSFGNPVS